MSPRLSASPMVSLLIAVGLVAPAGCQQLASDLGGGSVATDAGPAVCVNGGSGADGLECCQAEGSACGGDYDCCGGLCSGGSCVSSGNTACSAALGSRCRAAASCACATDDDCCQQPTGAVCTNSSVTTSGKRCCLSMGIPCGGDGDCCSGSCDATTLACN